MLIKTNHDGITRCVPEFPVIGKHWRKKPCGFVDQRDGTYWETYPEVSKDSLKLQKALLDPSTEYGLQLIAEIVMFNSHILDYEIGMADLKKAYNHATS